MCKRSNSACKISFLLFLLTIFCFASLASISVNGVVFDSAVVNDNARQATPSNYSCIQSGGTVTLSGQQPKSTANVTYFYNHASQASEWKFMAGINFSNLTDTNSLMGIMFYSGNLVAGAGDQGWYRLGITGNRRVYLETHNFCDPPRKDLLCTLKINVTTAYIMAKIESGMLSFFVSDAPIITGNELEVIQIGSPIYFPYSHLYGFFLEPHVTTGFERAVFNSMSIIPRNSTNGINSLNNYTVPGVSGLSDWSSITLPPGFFNTPMKLIRDIRSKYIGGTDKFADPLQRRLFTNMVNMKNNYTVMPITGSELQCIDLSIHNAQIYLADILDSLITGNIRKYPSQSTAFQLYFGFSLNDLLQQGIDLVNACHAATETHWYDFFNPIEPFTRLYNIGDCGSDIIGLWLKYSAIMQTFGDKDNIIMDGAQYIENLALMALLDRNFYNTYYICINGYFELVRAFIKKAAPVYSNNNIPMKVYSALALWDLAHNTTTSSATLNLLLKDRFMDGGAYAEGSHYLDWLNKELLPYYFISAYNDWLPTNLQLTSVKNSGYWLLNMADKSGIIAPIDDGTNDEHFWLAPYSYFNNDNAFKEYDTSSYSYNEPLKFLTYPPQNYPGHFTVNPIGVYEGIGKINYNSSTDSEEISVTLPTETSGKIKEKGSSHDQEDDGSISVRRHKRGDPFISDLIIDPGYAGYLHKSKEEYFDNHNTVQITSLTHGGIDACPIGTLDTCMKIASQALGIDINGTADGLLGAVVLFVCANPVTEAILPMPWSTIPIVNYYGDKKNQKDSTNRIGAGGPGYSDMVKVYSNGFQAKITYDTKTDYALRSVLHIDDDIFVIDQISSNSGDYAVHYNMPPNTTGSNNIYIGIDSTNVSKIRLSEFCSDNLKPTILQNDSFGINGQDINRLHVSSVRFSNDRTNLPGPGSFCSFLTTLEPASALFGFGAAYTPVSGNTGSAQICVSRQINANVWRYVFVNTVTNDVGGPLTIPARSGWHSIFSTDAQYGVIDFDRTTQSYILTHTNLYLGTYARYNGNNAPFNKATINPSAIQTKVFGGSGNTGTASYIPSTKNISLVAQNYASGKATNGYTFGYWYVEGDFDLSFPLPMIYNFGRRPGFLIKTSLVGNDPKDLWLQEKLYDPCAAYCAEFSKTNPGQTCYCEGQGPQYDRIWVCYGADTVYNPYWPYRNDANSNYRCKRIGNKIELFANTLKVASIPADSPFVYLGYTFWKGSAQPDTAHFDTLSNTSSVANLTKKATLTALGYTTNGQPVSGWDLNSQNGYIYSTTMGDSARQVSISSPQITTNRNNNGGTTIEWMAQFPAWYYNQDFSQNNRLQIDITTSSGTNGYSLVFMPTADNSHPIPYDFQLKKTGLLGALSQLNSGTITPLNDTTWVKFRVDILPTPSSGGAGEIKVYYDPSDGMGYVRELSVIDTSYSDFRNLTFTYSTGKSPDNYTVRISDINVTQLKSEFGLPDYRYSLIPVLDRVIYKGSGTWNATFGYTNPNAVSITKSIDPTNGFTYKGTANLNYGQPTTFSPGTAHSVFNVDFDGSNLVWTLDSFSLTAVPTYLLRLEMKDNGVSENNISKPQIRLTNIGTQPISGFRLRLWFSREEYFSQQIIADKYYVNPSGITLSQGVHPSNANIVFVDVNYPTSFQLAAGAKTTDDGVQLGVHFNNYYPGQWTKSNDWSWQGITGAFSETRNVTIYNQNGDLIYGNEPNSSATPQPPSLSMADVFGFEKLNGWIAPLGSNSLNTTNKTQGASSLKMTGGGYQTINSIDMPTANITGETSKLKVDIYIGSTQPNPYWIGALQLFASCPSAGLYNAYLGQCELTGKPYNAFSTLSFTITNDVLAVLRGTYTDFSFKWALNTNANSGPYSLDNMRFVTP